MLYSSSAAAVAFACLAATARAAVPWASEYSNEAVPPPPPACKAISATGVDYSDANLTVVPAGGGGGAWGGGGGDHGCCAACQAYNAKSHHGPNCSFVVWHRDSAVCALKATANS